MRVWFAVRIVAAAAATAIAGWAQASPSAPAFEVASIRPVDLGRGRGSVEPPRVDASRVDLPFISLAYLIPWAFRVKDYQVSAPTWVHESFWSISAKLPDGSSQDQAPEMMQTLLKDRFGLAVHRDAREQPAYTLTVASGGPALVAASPDEVPARDGSLPGFDFSGPLHRTGIISGRIVLQPNCSRQYQFVPLSMEALADTLAQFLGRPVAEETGLKGTYKVTLEVPTETEAGMTLNLARGQSIELPPGGGRGAGGGGRGGDDPGPGEGPRVPPKELVTPGCSDPSQVLREGSYAAPDAGLIRALQKIGLKLQSGRAAIETIVVDRLEKTPTEN